MTSRSQSSAGLHPVPGNGGASPVFSRLLNDFARGQRLAIQLSRQGERDAAEMPHDRGDCDSAVDPDEDNSGLEPATDTMCQNCGEAPWTRHDPKCQVFHGEAGRVCQRCFELCSDCGNHPVNEGHSATCSQHPDNIREAAMCRYCGQDHCVCGKRYGYVQGIVSRREAGRKA